MYRTRDFRRKKMALIKRAIENIRLRFGIDSEWAYRNNGRELMRWFHRRCPEGKHCISCSKNRTRSRLRQMEEEKYNLREEILNER